MIGWGFALGVTLVLGGVLAAQTPPGRPRTFSLALIRSRCIEFSDIQQSNDSAGYRECSVSKFDELGSVDGQTYYFALYCLIPGYDEAARSHCGDGSLTAQMYSQRGLAVFAGAPGGDQARLLFERVEADFGALFYMPPEIVRTAAGTILYLPIAVDGTGHGNASEYYLRERSGWQSIESEAWLKDLVRRLPPGLAIWKGVWPDLHSMQAEAGLYRDGDGNCCPTGGVARIRVAIRGRKFVIDSVAFEKAE